MALDIEMASTKKITLVFLFMALFFLIAVAVVIFSRSIQDVVWTKEHRFGIRPVNFHECTARALSRIKGILVERNQSSIDVFDFSFESEPLPSIGGQVERVNPEEIRITLFSREKFSPSREQASDVLFSKLSDSLRQECVN